MKRSQTMLAMILFLMAGCGGGKQSDIPGDGLITVDVTASYPKKELILQDFMDVEYIPLETTDEFLCQGLVLAINKDILVARNYANDGNIYIFDRKTGKGIKKINRQGQGGEEYTFVQRIVLDEDNGEMFINDHQAKKIIVYDLDGNFKRSLKLNEELQFFNMYNFDRENLICNNDWVTDRPPFTIISKQDGSITTEIQIPFKEKIQKNLTVEDEAKNMTYSVSPQTYYPMIPDFGSWILVEQSTDTVYRYDPDHTMTPIAVRTPPVVSMDPEVFLFLSIFTDRYYFMESVKKVFHWDSDWAKSEGFPATDLMYDKQEKAIFNYTVYNDDYVDKTVTNMKSTPVNNEVATWQSLDVGKLLEDYGKGKLKGKLKEIASKLDEESNPVIMLIKQKK